MSLNIDQITQIDEIQIVDADGNLAVIKAASTAAGTADTSLVVALSPNSPLPSGTNTIGAVTQASGPWTVNLTQVAGSAVALGQTTMSASLPVTIASNQSALPVSQNGTWTTGRTWTLASGTDSVASVQSGSWTTGRTWTLASGTDSVSSVQSGTWNIGTLTSITNPVAVTQSTSPWVDNITQFGGNNVVTGTGASGLGIPRVTVSNDSNILATQSGAWTTGRTWTLASGIDSISAVQSGTWTVQQGSAPWSQNLTQIGGSAITLGQKLAASSVPVVTQQDNSFSTVNITAQDAASTSATVANGQVFVTGTPTANSAASFAVSSWVEGQIQVTGTWTGTLVIEVSVDGGTTWLSRGVKQSGVSYIINSFTANFSGQLSIAGVTNVRVRSTAAWTGTATVLLVASVHPDSIVVSNPILFRDSTTQSIANTIKAASTAAVATDTALVVAVSPNNTVAVTQSTSPWVTKDQSDGPVAPGSVASFSSLVGGQYNSTLPTLTNTQQSAAQLDVNGRLSTTTTDYNLTGSLTALNSAVTVAVNGVGSFTFVLSGTWVGTVVAEGSPDAGTSWQNLGIVIPTTAGIILTGVTVNGIYRIIVPGGFNRLRLRMSAYTSGTASVVANASAVVATPAVYQNNAANLNAQVVGNVAAAAADSGNPVKIGGVFSTSSPAYLTNGQRSNHATDLVGRQIIASEISSATRWGQVFHVTTNHISTGATAETPLMSITNPNASGKSLRLGKLIFSGPTRVTGNFNTYRIYMNPTITAAGTNLTVTGARQTNQNATVASSHSLPTTSANGTLFFTVDVSLGVPFVFEELSQWIEANNSILITTTLSNAADTACVTAEWIEE